MKQMKKNKIVYHILILLKGIIVIGLVLTMYYVIIAYVKVKCMTKLVLGLGGRI